jgi:amino acid adenylation domain-containing protein
MGPQVITRRSPEGRIPLSYRQEQVWLHAQVAPDVPVYNETLTIHRTGPLDAAALERSLREIIHRHEAWRTTFAAADGDPIQIIHPDVAISLPVVDLRALPEAKREKEALRLATEDALQPFDLAQGPLLRAKLIRLADEEHRLFLTLHHIIFDTVSIYRVFLPELISLYEAFSAGKPSPLPEPLLQYADYALWRRQWLQGDVLSEQMSYWRRQLGGELPVLQLPTDRPRPPVQTFRGAMQKFFVRKEVADALKQLSQRQGVTLFMTLLTAFNILLHRYTGQDDLLVGCAVGGRNRSEIQNLMGYFLDTLVLRNDLSGNPTFRKLLPRVREVTLGALANEEVPFEHVVRELHPKRDVSRSPIIQVLFSLEPPLPTLPAGWNLTWMDVDTGATKFDVCLELDDRPEGLVGRFTYSTDLFESATIARMVRHWESLLESILAHPELPVAELPLLTEGERRQFFTEWNDTQAEFPRACIHELFEAQVERTPEAVAVIFDRQHLSYRELNQRANQLAHHLRSMGVGPETLVAICVERSLDMAVGLLGILKAGAAYVPLDPAYPAGRLALMLDDAEPAVVLTQEALRQRLPDRGARVLRLDADWSVIAANSISNLEQTASPENLAYVIYTSGSTGKPKGAQIEHRSVVNFLTSMQRSPGLEPDDVLVAVTSLSFDIAGLEMYLPLITGARLVIARREVSYDGFQLMALLRESGATVMQATPATWRLLVEAGWDGTPGVKIMCGGEPLPPELGRELVARGKSVWNLYGPTETTIWSSVYRVKSVNGSMPPIGRPIANTEFYILDHQGQPVPLGVKGELYIGGEGVARGYLQRPELTAERFIPDPFSARRGARLYRTGDVARYRPDGNIELFGRFDHQVKIRGYRIEPAEVEAVLGQHPAVRDVVVVAREDEPGSKALVAYYVPSYEAAPFPSELRDFLCEKVPPYMIPSAFVELKAIPRLPNGKVDRKALPAPEKQASAGTPQFVPPRDAVEARLKKIWEGVLGTSVGVQLDFFDLGGHSLLAARLLARLEKEFGKKLSLASLFEAPTIERMAALLRRPNAPPQPAEVVPIQPEGSRPPFFCICSGSDPVLGPLAQRLGADQPFLGLRLRSSVTDELAVPYRLEDIAGHLVKAIRERQREGPYLVGGCWIDGLIAYEVARQLHTDGQDVALVALFDAPNMGYYSHSSGSTESNELARWLKFQRLGFYLANLRQLKTGDKPGNLRARLDYFLRDFRGFLRQIYVDSRLRWVGRLRDLPDILFVAARGYHPRPYSGRVALLQPRGSGARARDSRWGWGALVNGGLVVREVPGMRLFVEPDVEQLARELRGFLLEAQGFVPESDPQAAAVR